ncbi:hypothetical protein SERLADRAFT_379756 [Serpula lacrymans var. lacrymans S7.9]|nr:uncharacterized protein SERLADRAFT_379756 [Serpula lacrymans var. lacrymans S7.9]EGO30054.1 hypothetical protein SERLADRAFT_379756 [Serpula lacrymans var. lacrymans S7.9]
MRLYSSRLPWYIDIRASNPIGATIGDVFTGLYTSLNTPIQKDDYYNEELDDADRYKLREAWEERCHDASERSCGVRRVDFLRGKIGFEGLVRGKDGMWEVKTRRQ